MIVRRLLIGCLLASQHALAPPDTGRPASAAEPSPESQVVLRRHHDAVPRVECFPVERIATERRARSKRLLLSALDSEALYTIVGDLKPISEGFFGSYFQADPPETSELGRVREAMSVWRCGEHFDTGVLVFEKLRDDERFASAWIASRPALEAKIEDSGSYFGRLGFSSSARAESVLLAIERAKNASERWRGFGLVFGYPKEAIDFFVRAGEHHATTGEFVQRDFRSYPTIESSSSSFVYAVPKLAEPTAFERTLRRRVEAILTVYRAKREQYITDDNPDRVVELIRDWFDDGTGWCHPDHAWQKAMRWDAARSWAEQHAIGLSTVNPTAEDQSDLERLDDVLSSPQIIALGESTHGTREFFQLKHRLFRYLVENHGVRLFGLEASFAACLPIDRYVQTGEGDPRDAIRGQGFWTWDTEEVLALVQWMRSWNEARTADQAPVRFYGFDTQDAFTPLQIALSELDSQSPSQAIVFRERLAPALVEQYGGSMDEANAAQLDELLRSIEDLAALFETLPGRSQESQWRTRLLLQQARSAIQIDQSRIDQWSSLEMRKELELYARIREKQTRVETWARGLRGEAATTFTQFVRAAKDVQKCQRQFRTELTHAQRQAWRKSVQWALKQADDDIQSAVQDLQQFLAITTESLEKPNELVNVRDETMAGLVESILEQHGEEARIMLWAHDWHISKFAGDPASDVPRMGTYLEQRRGTDYLPVGLSFGSGTFQAKYSPKPDEDPAKLVLREFRVDGSREDSFSNVFDHCDAPLAAFVLSGQPLEALPPWMKLPHPNRTIGAVYRPSLGRTDAYYEDVVLDRHFELVFHVPETTRAKPLHPVARFRFGAQFDEPPESQQRSGQQAHVTVKSVSPKSLAEKCGLRVGDQIVEFEGKEIAGKVDFESALAGVERPGSHALRVRREGDPVEGPAERQELILYLVVPAWIAESWPDGRSPFER